MIQPLVSIVISTKNEEENIENVLKSLKKQTYKNIEVIVVDNNSTDKTKEIAKIYTDKVFNKGPERSWQRNFGLERAKGDFVLILDADMILTERVIEEAIELISKDSKMGGIIIPEISIGQSFWAQCKALEKSFYINSNIEAARFYKKKILKELSGFDVDLVSGEDWDLSQRVGDRYELGRIKSLIYHNEGRLSLFETIKTKFYYGQHIGKYLKKKHGLKNIKKQTSILGRFWIFLSKPTRLFRNPLIGLGLLFMKTCEFGFGGLGYLISKMEK